MQQREHAVKVGYRILSTQCSGICIEYENCDHDVYGLSCKEKGGWREGKARLKDVGGNVGDMDKDSCMF